jgi:hypothetical protein
MDELGNSIGWPGTPFGGSHQPATVLWSIFPLGQTLLVLPRVMFAATGQG